MQCPPFTAPVIFRSTSVTVRTVQRVPVQIITRLFLERVTVRIVP